MNEWYKNLDAVGIFVDTCYPAMLGCDKLWKVVPLWILGKPQMTLRKKMMPDSIRLWKD